MIVTWLGRDHSVDHGAELAELVNIYQRGPVIGVLGIFWNGGFMNVYPSHHVGKPETMKMMKSVEFIGAGPPAP